METNQQRMIITRNQDFLLRFATADDAALIVEYARKLGEFQHMLHAVTASEEDAAHLIAEKKGEVVFGYYQGKIVGFMYFTEKSSILQTQPVRNFHRISRSDRRCSTTQTLLALPKRG